MLDYCPNCGGKDIEQTDKNTIYCPKCDQSFKESKGKVQPEKKGRLDKIEQDVERIKENQGKLAKDLYGDESALPFI